MNASVNYGFVPSRLRVLGSGIELACRAQARKLPQLTIQNLLHLQNLRGDIAMNPQILCCIVLLSGTLVILFISKKTNEASGEFLPWIFCEQKGTRGIRYENAIFRFSHVCQFED